MREIRSINEIDLDSDQRCLFVTRNPDSIRETGLKYRLVYSTLPEWIKKLNFNNWVERTKLWYVYEIHAAGYGPHSERFPYGKADGLA